MKYRNFPEPLSYDLYEEARAEISAICGTNCDVASVYEYGSVRNPGISDIDLLFICSDTPSDNLMNLGQTISRSKALEITVGHATLMVIPLFNASRILIWDDINLTHRSGHVLDFNAYEDGDLELYRIVDWLPERIVRMVQTLESPLIDVRKTLGLLKSTSYSINKVYSLLDLNIRDDSFIHAINNLRDEWFQLTLESQTEHLNKLLLAGISSGISALEGINNFLNDLDFTHISYSSLKLNIPGPNGFSYNYVPRSSIDYTLGKGGLSSTHIELPSLYASFYKSYINQNGIISDAMKGAATGPWSQLVTPPSRTQRLLKERMMLCNEWAFYLRENRINKGLFKFGWFFE